MAGRHGDVFRNTFKEPRRITNQHTSYEVVMLRLA
jgi:hypothetical protein